MTRRSPSNETTHGAIQPHPWLQKHYEEKRERTVRLVKAAVDQLVKEQQMVTIEAVCGKSIEVDSDGRGVKKSAILENPEAHAYYRQHSASYKAAQARKRKGRVPVPAAQPLRIDLHRNVDRVRYRYLQMTKAELVERLLTVEQAHAEVHQQLAQLQFQLLEQEQQNAEQQRQERRHHKQTSEG